MTIPKETIKRSVDSLQRLYAIIVGLAIAAGIRQLFLKDGVEEYQFHIQRLPMFIALFVTAVPFLHGMNRHQDKTLTKIFKDQNPNLFHTILVDFVFFSIESCMLFALAILVRMDLQSFFWPWVILLIIDVVWACITWLMLKQVAWAWAIVNAIVIVVSIGVLYFVPDSQAKIIILMSIAIVRTIADYKSAWTFYFPTDEAEEL